MYNNPLITIPRLQHSGNDNWEHHRGMGIAAITQKVMPIKAGFQVWTSGGKPI